MVRRLIPCLLFWNAAAHAAASPISVAELRTMVREIAPVVADVAGRDFDHLPEVVLADPRLIASVLYDEELSLQADAGVPEGEATASARRSMRQADIFAGKYGFLDGRLYVSVDEIRYTLGAQGSPAYLLRPLVRVVIAHELAHALQDQHTDLDRLAGQSEGSDAVMAIKCALEGHAVWIQEAVADRLGLEEAQAVMAELMGYREPIGPEMDPGAFFRAYLYGLGRDFVAFHADLGGTDQVWRVIEHPPGDTSTIVFPERWGDASEAVGVSTQRTLARASRRLAGRDWRPSHAAMGDYGVRDQLIRAGSTTEAADGIREGWNAAYVGEASEQSVEVQLLRFDTAARALGFVSDMRGQAEARAEAMAWHPLFEATAGEFQDVGADATAHEAITVHLLDGPDEVGRVWAALGADVVQVITVNAEMEDRRIATAIRRVLRSLPSG